MKKRTLKQVWSERPARTAPPFFSARVMSSIKAGRETGAERDKLLVPIWRFAGASAFLACLGLVVSFAQEGLPWVDILGLSESPVMGFLF